MDELKGTMKEKLDSVDKLQANLDEANAAKANLENQEKAIENQVAELQQQVQTLQAQAQENRAATGKVAKLEMELEEVVAIGKASTWRHKIL